ncbi:unnamed protein product [Chrysodeixis includens]|uniref:Uncharacterized protein n=1 Tax=Chrysodeixis includens TaxID=689277 RepID=A0A9P0BK91_CHRIL|nr:unnamed protein product [Chrysodeixis includens]
MQEGGHALPEPPEPDSDEQFLRRLTANHEQDDLDLSPDYLEINHTRKTPNNLRFNVSMDYAELFNFSMEHSDLHLSEPLAGFSGLSNRNGAATLASYNQTAVLIGNGTHTVGRRALPVFHKHSNLDSNLHVLELMKQNVYMIQERILDIEPLLKLHETDTRFRIAYAFNKIEDWVKDMRSMYYAMKKGQTGVAWRNKKHLVFYEHILRKNIDITYSTELLIHIHNKYMTRLNEVVTKDHRAAFNEMKKNKSAKQNNPTDLGRRSLSKLPLL